MFIKITVVLLIILILLDLTSASNIWILCKDEPETGVTINSVQISGCTALPCKFKKGTNGSMIFSYTTNKDFDEALTAVCGDFHGACVPFPLKDNNECHQGAKCPMKKGDVETVKLELYIDPHFPTIELPVKIKIEDSSKTVQGCFEVAVVIAN